MPNMNFVWWENKSNIWIVSQPVSQPVSRPAPTGAQYRDVKFFIKGHVDNDNPNYAPSRRCYTLVWQDDYEKMAFFRGNSSTAQHCYDDNRFRDFVDAVLLSFFFEPVLEMASRFLPFSFISQPTGYYVPLTNWNTQGCPSDTAKAEVGQTT